MCVRARAPSSLPIVLDIPVSAHPTPNANTPTHMNVPEPQEARRCRGGELPIMSDLGPALGLAPSASKSRLPGAGRRAVTYDDVYTSDLCSCVYDGISGTVGQDQSCKFGGCGTRVAAAATAAGGGMERTLGGCTGTARR